jgi:uncharacterized membrane protein
MTVFSQYLGWILMSKSSILLPQMPKTLLLSIAALMTALVAVLTVSFQIAVPATQGYFNLGEVGVYITALLFGPIIGGVAGGVGSMIADLATGYVLYAPGTLLIKGFEGFAVGYLSWAFRERFAPKQLRYLGIGIGLGLAVCMVVIGVLRFGGELASWGSPWWEIPFLLPSWVWFILAVFLGSMAIFLTLRYDSKVAWNITSMLMGGVIIIAGYFLYEFFIFQYAAITELPINFMQVMMGILIAIPITERLLLTVKNLGWIG